VQDHHDVGWLDIPMNDPLEMSMLDRLAQRDEQPQPLLCVQLVPVAVLCDRDPLYITNLVMNIPLPFNVSGGHNVIETEKPFHCNGRISRPL